MSKTKTTGRPRSLSERSIVREMADHISERLTRRAIARLQRIHHTLSDNDSGLTSIWDEICVQEQGERTLFWDAYVSAMQDVFAWDVSQLPPHELDALWLQTPEGKDWSRYDNEGHAGDARDESVDYPVCADDIVRYLASGSLRIEADRWTNSRIRSFFDRTAG